MELSIVIICKNDVTGIERTLQSVRGLGAEILVYDSGSIDGTKEVALKNGASLYEGEWEGYGRNRFKAAQLAKYDWILMLDTDEVVDEALKESIKLLDFTSQHQVYRLYKIISVLNGYVTANGVKIRIFDWETEEALKPMGKLFTKNFLCNPVLRSALSKVIFFIIQ
ncbi:MAG: glycosyltransferase [Chitinophagaceae bacterium]|nr:glycosyltransferase [Chitinophagaceae bacterium]